MPLDAIRCIISYGSIISKYHTLFICADSYQPITLFILHDNIKQWSSLKLDKCSECKHKFSLEKREKKSNLINIPYCWNFPILFSCPIEDCSTLTLRREKEIKIDYKSLKYTSQSDITLRKSNICWLFDYALISRHK